MARTKNPDKETVATFRTSPETMDAVKELAATAGLPKSIMLDLLVVEAVKHKGMRARALDAGERAARLEVKNLRAHLLRTVADGLETYDG